MDELHITLQATRAMSHCLLCCHLALQIAIQFIKVKASKKISGKNQKSRLEWCQRIQETLLALDFVRPND